MPIVKAVVTDLESSPTTKHLYPYQTKLKLEGDKKPDTLEAIFGMQDDIDQNYEIKFLQDIVDTSYLRVKLKVADLLWKPIRIKTSNGSISYKYFPLKGELPLSEQEIEDNYPL